MVEDCLRFFQAGTYILPCTTGCFDCSTKIYELLYSFNISPFQLDLYPRINIPFRYLSLPYIEQTKVDSYSDGTLTCVLKCMYLNPGSWSELYRVEASWCGDILQVWEQVPPALPTEGRPIPNKLWVFLFYP